MQTQPNDVDKIFTTDANKLTVRVHFWDENERYGFINIDPAIIDKLHINSETILTQEVTEAGILLRRLKEI